MEPGTQIGHYTILSAVGKGGMGEVWKAHDTKLGREVAIKTLPEEFARDRDRLARFEREAKLLASLNHPNIAAIYGFEEDHGTYFLVLELVEGPTLADRIAQGSIPVDEALPLARQIAEALEAAHDKGIIHRDLKPANIKVTPEGNVKVLDFGLAKAMEATGASPTLSQSPTISTPAMTQAGVILGTAAYMSPEQARGKTVDKRSDIWAFGCVLYEMLTGRRAFLGDDVTETLAAVVKSEPDWDRVPKLPRLLDAFLRQCLRKDARHRLQAIGDVRLVLEGAFQTTQGETAEAAAPPPLWRRAVPSAVMVAVTSLIVASIVWVLRTPVPPRVTRLAINLPVDQSFIPSPLLPNLALSPDGN